MLRSHCIPFCQKNLPNSFQKIEFSYVFCISDLVNTVLYSLDGEKGLFFQSIDLSVHIQYVPSGFQNLNFMLTSYINSEKMCACKDLSA